jgi:hypothetical protein
VVTGSKVIVDGALDAPAKLTCWPVTGTNSVRSGSAHSRRRAAHRWRR